MARTEQRQRSRGHRRPKRNAWIRIERAVADPKWTRAAGWTAIGLGVLLLAWIAFALHVVGDYFTESDFYGGYAAGARGIQAGHLDPGRYLIAGPGYEVMLAVVGFLVRDLFTAAKLLSVGASAITLISFHALLSRRASPAAGLWMVAFVLANATFLRYGFSSTADAPAAGLQSASLLTAFAWAHPAAPFVAGMLAAGAALTRYSAAAWMVATLLVGLWIDREVWPRRWRGAVLYLAGATVVLAPWLAYSISRGHVPGEQLFSHYSWFYGNPSASRNVQDLPVRGGEGLPSSGDAVAAASPARWISNLGEHGAEDVRTLLGWPVAAWCALGAVLVLRERLLRRLAPLWISGLALFIALGPVFYSDRYELANVPVYLAFAGIAARSSPVLRLGGLRVPVLWCLAALPLVFSVRHTRAEIERVLSQMPVETREAGEALRREAAPGSRVMSRKGHIGYYSGLPVVAFPRIQSLPELAEHCRVNRVEYIFLSWYEAELRPEYWALLDTTRKLPGLEVVHVTTRHPSVTYRVGPEFGTIPPWFASDSLRNLQAARAQVRVLDPGVAWGAYLLAGNDALVQGRYGEAERLFGAVVAVRPREALAWSGRGEARVGAGRTAEATADLERALSLDASLSRSRFALGWLQLQSGEPQRAAQTWRPLLEARQDARVLSAMLPLYEQVGDREAAAAIRAALGRR